MDKFNMDISHKKALDHLASIIIDEEAEAQGYSMGDLIDEELHEDIADAMIDFAKNYREDETEKPPLGIKPKALHREERLLSLLGAIHRYLKVGKKIPGEWMFEVNNLIVEIHHELEEEDDEFKEFAKNWFDENKPYQIEGDYTWEAMRAVESWCKKKYSKPCKNEDDSKELTLAILSGVEKDYKNLLSSKYQADHPAYHEYQDGLENTRKAIEWVKQQ